MIPDTIIVETTRRIFRDLADPQTVHNSTDESWCVPLWSALVDAGLTLAWCAEDKGGAGASLVDGFAIQRVVGEFATPIPLAETLLASWLLDQVKIKPPTGRMTVAPVDDKMELTLSDDGLLNGVAERVPFARQSDHIVVIADSNDGSKIAMVHSDACALSHGHNLAGESRDRVSFDGVRPAQVATDSNRVYATKLKLMGATMRAMQMTGAIEKILNMCVGYTQERIAFGRPIAKFQVIQHNLAIMAGELAAALAATGAAAGAFTNNANSMNQIVLNVASAKIRVGEAANEVCAIAHQLHGAIGFTQEHILHCYSHRLWSWRDEYGNEAIWAVLLGKNISAHGPDELWPSLTAA